jgi:hypothetical protein
MDRMRTFSLEFTGQRIGPSWIHSTRLPPIESASRAIDVFNLTAGKVAVNE